MSQQQAELYRERMQRTLTILETLWWMPDIHEDDLFFLACELGLKNEFYQLINPRRLASVGN